MPEIMPTDQIMYVLGLLCTAIFLLGSYLIKGLFSTQKEHGKMLEQVVIKMGSLENATQANSKAIGDIVVIQRKTHERMEEAQKESNKEFKAAQKENNEHLINGLKLIIDNKILISQRSSQNES